MELRIQKRLAAQILKCSPGRVWFNSNNLDEIKESITKLDIKSLIRQDIIKRKPAVGVSKVRARKIKLKRRKGRQQGQGSRKGKRTARLPKKKKWMNKIRVQRKFLKHLKEKGALGKGTYQDLYMKSKGGFFRSKRHLKIYIDEHGLSKK